MERDIIIYDTRYAQWGDTELTPVNMRELMTRRLLTLPAYVPMVVNENSEADSYFDSSNGTALVISKENTRIFSRTKDEFISSVHGLEATFNVIMISGIKVEPINLSLDALKTTK